MVLNILLAESACICFATLYCGCTTSGAPVPPEQKRRLGRWLMVIGVIAILLAALVAAAAVSQTLKEVQQHGISALMPLETVITHSSAFYFAAAVWDITISVLPFILLLGIIAVSNVSGIVCYRWVRSGHELDYNLRQLLLVCGALAAIWLLWFSAFQYLFAQAPAV